MKLSPHVRLRYSRRDRTIATCHPQKIEEHYRFRSASQSKTVFYALHIPYRLTLSNIECFFGEEIFVIGLRRLNYPCKLGTLVRTEFGRSLSSISRAFKYCVQHVYSSFLGKLSDNLDFYADNFSLYAEAIRTKLTKIGVRHLPGNYNLCGFIDNTNHKACRQGGGLVAPGVVGSERHDLLLQRAFFCTHKYCHELKWQTVVFPNGLIGHSFGGLSAKRNDVNDLNDSNINGLMADAQLNKQRQYKLFGDGIYPTMSPILSKHRGHPLTARKQLENSGQSSIRGSIEWPYADISNQFAFVDFRKNMKLRLSPVKETFFTAILLSSLYCILNSNTTGSYFG